MTLNSYYLDELSYLRELGEEFAHRNPDLAPFLARQSNDPDVERLLEAFAFLAGRIRQKLDDELPELSHSLLAVLWPSLLRPIPPMAILACQPVVGALNGSQRIEPGAEYLSRPIDGTVCRFCNPFGATFHALAVTRAALDAAGQGACLALNIEPTRGAVPDALAADPLRLHLAFERDPAAGRTLLLWLQRHLLEVRVKAGGEDHRLGPQTVRPVGFDGDEMMLPAPPAGFLGHQLLQEYLVFPQKFLFIDLVGLGRFLARGPVTLEFRFDRPPDPLPRLDESNLRLNCLPVVNLFPLGAVPLGIDRGKSEYRVVPGAQPTDHYQVFSVDRVSATSPRDGRVVAYPPFQDFAHIAPRPGARGAFHHLRRRPAVNGLGPDVFVSLVSGDNAPLVPEAEVVSLELTCGNGALAAGLPAGAVCRASGSSPTFLSFANLAPPTAPAAPPLDSALLSRLVANLSVGYRGLSHIDSLRSLLAAFDFAALDDQQARRRLELRLDGLQRITARPYDFLTGGHLVRGQDIELVVAESKLGGEGEMFLLGSVLNALFAHAATVNSLHRLRLCGSERSTRLEWPARSGTGVSL